MNNEKADFVAAFERYIKEELRTSIEPAEYNKDAIKIVDARNHLFKNVGHQATDEEADVYALNDLCCVDEGSFCVVPNVMKLHAIACNFWR